MTSTSTSSGRKTEFGTFGGVFTPCVLTILGVIMFLRFGQVVGQAGLLECLLIVLIAKTITVLTSLSLSATATNTRVKGGGAYYLISRSLGVEYGGAIGIVFFLAQAVSVAMYVVGFTEAFLSVFPDSFLSHRELATLVNLFVFACVYIGAGWTIKIQYGILAILALSILSFGIGAAGDFSPTILMRNLQPAYPEGSNFFVMFALFFPAVTGIMAGANMSGDLKDPGYSIPVGTLGAVFVTALVYSGIAILLAGSREQGELLADTYVVQSVSRWPVLVIAGVFAATISSALGSMMGSPRILQALAKDGIFRRLRMFSNVEGKNREPRRAIILTALIAQGGVMIGSLDLIAPVITMFFMITYGALNLACFYEAFIGNPSFRPAFRFTHWSLSLAGALGCLCVMLLIAPVWAIVAIASISLLHWYVSRKEILSRWGDVQSGIVYERARVALLRLEEEKYHPKNWRPSILALNAGQWSEDYRVAEYAYWLQGGRGIVTLAQVIKGDVENRFERREEEESQLRKYIRREELDAFTTVVVEENFVEGAKALLQSHGIGGFQPNTLLIAWEKDSRKSAEIAEIVQIARDLDRSVVAIKADESLSRWQTPEGSIDVWWKEPKNGALMLIFAHMLTRTWGWRHRPIRLLHAVSDEEEVKAKYNQLEKLLKEVRVIATPEVVVTDDIKATIRENSKEAGIVFLGFDPLEGETKKDWHKTIQSTISHLGDVVLVSNAGDVNLKA